MRRERTAKIMELVTKLELIKHDRLAAIVSVETGCSMARAFEYIKVLVLADKLEIENGFVALPRQKPAHSDSA